MLCVDYDDLQLYGSSDSLGPYAKPVPGASWTAGPAAGTGGSAAAAVGVACSVLQRAECPQRETGGVELPTLLPAEVTSSITVTARLHQLLTGRASQWRKVPQCLYSGGLLDLNTR